MKFMAAVLLLLMLAGCAGGEGFFQGGDYAMYVQGHTDHGAAEATRISAQSAAIANAAALAKPATQTESMLLAVIAMQQIERLAPTPLNIAKPTTGYDVLDKLVGHVPMVAAVGGMWQLGKIGIENAGQISIAEGANVTDSINRTNVSTLGTNNGVTYTGTAPAQVVEPTIVETEAVTVPAQ
jgi:hypothetical protein